MEETVIGQTAAEDASDLHGQIDEMLALVRRCLDLSLDELKERQLL